MICAVVLQDVFAQLKSKGESLSKKLYVFTSQSYLHPLHVTIDAVEERSKVIPIWMGSLLRLGEKEVDSMFEKYWCLGSNE